jgi:surface protein
MWCSNPTKALKQYGHISKWNTSLVIDMSKQFQDKKDFNDDISKWNVRNVTGMSRDYESTGSFNGDISEWNVSNSCNVTNITVYPIPEEHNTKIPENSKSVLHLSI